MPAATLPPSECAVHGPALCKLQRDVEGEGTEVARVNGGARCPPRFEPPPLGPHVLQPLPRTAVCAPGGCRRMLLV